MRVAKSGESQHELQPVEQAASGHHQARSFELLEFGRKSIHQLSSVSWRFELLYGSQSTWLVQSLLGFTCSHSAVGSHLQYPQFTPSHEKLINYLQERRVIPRLSVIIASGFYCDQTIPWTRFLFEGVYDPRLFLFIFDFVLNFEEGRKRGRFEE